jgi:hypothetical protein
MVFQPLKMGGITKCLPCLEGDGSTISYEEIPAEISIEMEEIADRNLPKRVDSTNGGGKVWMDQPLMQQDVAN